MSFMGFFRSGLGGLALSLAFTGSLAAQEPSVEQLQVQYDEALKQLQAAQDRKNELAVENEQLKKQVEALTETVYSSRRQAIYLQTHFNLWQLYVAAFPNVGRWFEMSAEMTSQYGAKLIEPFQFADLNWPFSAIEPSTTANVE